MITLRTNPRDLRLSIPGRSKVRLDDVGSSQLEVV
jgi:hypothetical protein